MYSISAEGDAAGPVIITAFGQVGSTGHRISGVLEKTGEPLLDAITLDGPFSSVSGGGSSFMISGIDEPLPNVEGEDFIGADGHAIRTTLTSSRDLFLGNIEGTQLVGIDGSADVVAGEPTMNLNALQDSILASPSLQVLQGDQKFNGNDVIGSRENPAIMSVNGNVRITGTVEGYGVLLINGSLRAPGTLKWEGIIIVSSDGGSTDLRGTVDIYGALIMRSLTDARESGGHEDAGLLGGHFDIDVMRSFNEIVYHEHQYDDMFDTGTIDFLTEGCDEGGGLCWASQVDSSGLDNVRIYLEGHDSVGGELWFGTSSSLIEGAISDGLDLEVDPADITTFRLDFSEICDVNGSSPNEVQLDEIARDGMLRLRVTDTSDTPSLLHEVVIYRHSQAATCLGSEDHLPVDVAPQTFYINGNVGIHRSAAALSGISGLLPFVMPEPAEIRLSSMRHVSNDGSI